MSDLLGGRWPEGPRRRRRVRGSAALVAAVLLAACGTRLPDEAFVRVGGGTGAGSGSGPVAEGGGAPGESSGGGTGGTGGGATATTTAATGGGNAGGSAGGGAGGATDPGAGGGGGAGGGTGAAGPNQASDVGVTETTIRIGTIVAENGVLGDTFQPSATGMRAWTQYMNARGGIGGRTIELFTCDDREDRARTLECARRLVEQDQVFALVGTNTRAMGGASQYLHDQGIPVIGQPINNAFYRYDNFFSIYGSPVPRNNATVGTDGQLSALTTMGRFLRQSLGADRAAVFSYDVPESNQAGTLFQRGLELEGFTVDRYVVSFAAPSFDAAVADMQRNGTQVILDSMDEGANRKLCDSMQRRQFTVLAKVSTVPLLGDSLGESFPDACRPVTYVNGDTRVYTDTSIPLVAAYRDSMARYQPGKELHEWGLEAFAMGALFEEALLAMGPAPTRAGLVEHLNGLDSASPGGLMTPTIDWHGNTVGAATMADCIGVARWDDASGGWVEATPFPFCIPDARQYFVPVAEQGN